MKTIQHYDKSDPICMPSKDADKYHELSTKVADVKMNLFQNKTIITFTM